MYWSSFEQSPPTLFFILLVDIYESKSFIVLDHMTPHSPARPGEMPWLRQNWFKRLNLWSVGLDPNISIPPSGTIQEIVPINIVLKNK